jgi:hypothetical protein
MIKGRTSKGRLAFVFAKTNRDGIRSFCGLRREITTEVKLWLLSAPPNASGADANVIFSNRSPQNNLWNVNAREERLYGRVSQGQAGRGED